MSLTADIEARWTCGIVLKRDVFSTFERGHFRTPEGEVEAVLRRIDQVPWWSFLIARALIGRERRMLAIAGTLGIAPPLILAASNALVRGWINGVALHVAKPVGDRAYFRSAKVALRKLHRAGICHNDLAKEQNWLRSPDGRAFVTDFQLAAHFRRRNRLFRIAAYEDLRHLLKHKRSYVPDALTSAERRVLARKSLFTRIWMATGKKIYRLITRGAFGFTDREGGGPRLVNDAPHFAARLRAHSGVRDVVIVAYPEHRIGVGLYAFVEGVGLSERELRDLLVAAGTRRPPEHLQVTDSLPRSKNGEARSEILQLVAMNQVDLIEPLITNELERAIVARILADRRNLGDRITFSR